MRASLASLALVVAAGTAHADVVYGRKGIAANEKASFAVVGYAGSLTQGFVNSNGHVLVQNGTGFQAIGTTASGNDVIEVKWDEVALPTGNFIDVIFRTRNGSDIVPYGTQLAGQPTAFWGWNVGSSDQIDFAGWVTEFKLIRATWSYSLNRGNSFIPGGNHTSRQNSPWNGFDPGDLLDGQFVGAGINAFQIRYQLELIPTPGALAVLGIAGLATRRRR